MSLNLALRLGAITPSASFAPSDLSALAYWFDADDAASITSSVGLVSQWNDKSGNGRHVTASGAARPTTGSNTLNGRNVLTFASSATLLTSSSTQNVQTCFESPGFTDTTGFYVVKLGTTAGKFGVVSLASTNFRWSIDCRDGTANYYDMGNASTARLSGDDGQAISQTNLISVRRSGASINARRNLSSVLSTAGASGTVGSETATFRIGSDAAFANWLVGDFAEIIIYARALSDTDRDSVESYLQTKWGTP